jgi:glycogen operon protein
MSKLNRQQLEHFLQQQGSTLDLQGKNLQQINLSQIDLRDADLHQVNLRDVNLSHANLQEVTFNGSNLSGANLSYALLNRSSLRHADLSRAILKHADLRDTDLREANLRGADICQADLGQAALSAADLGGADMYESNLREADLRGARLIEATINMADLKNAQLAGANLQRANLFQADLSEADLSHTHLNDANLSYACLQLSNLTGADLRGADLRHADLYQTDLRGSRYNRQTQWPEGFNPYEAGVIFSEEHQSHSNLTSIWSGKPYPLGATWDGQGVNFALFSEHASRVELCLFDTPDAPFESVRVAMREQTDNVWHVYLPNLNPGQVYGYRVYGSYNPAQGERFNPNKLLVDPYARAITGTINWNNAMYGYQNDHPDRDLTFDESDSAPYAPRCLVVDTSFPWGDDRPLNIPLHESVIYELHVRGFTMQHPDVPEHLRGTYAGLATPPVIEYLKSLGITAVELLPVHQFVDDHFLVKRGLRNYWGYNTLNFFAPESRYGQASRSGDQVREFKAMVKTLHAAGIEVILDVVYNHTAEGNHLGPTLSLRGIDNQSYYRLVPGNLRYYMDYTGTGNSLNLLHSRTLQLIMDSLRYWITEMHVDGFRFDLASTLARGLHEADRLSAFFDVIHQDPVISQVKLIAEPWDVGPGGYQVGNFPVLWSEWNGKYRDTVRRFWRGDESQVAELAYRLAGSSDLYQHNGRRPYASINFVTAHDGFTLHDLVSYNHKHNEANKEGNRDGDDHNNSWNCGIEGPTDDPQINALRERQMRNLMATLLLSQGVPMILAGDEFGRTQGGNNNAYCQDNEIAWIDWYLDNSGRNMLDFTRQIIQLRKRYPVLHRRRFFQGRRIHGRDIRDIVWWRPDGREMDDEEWSNGLVRCLGMMLNGQAMSEWDERGQRVYDDVLLVMFNAHHEMIRFLIPKGVDDRPWNMLIDTSLPDVSTLPVLHSGRYYLLQGRSLVMLTQQYTPEHTP